MSRERKDSQETPASASKASIPRSVRSRSPDAKRSPQGGSRASSRHESNGSASQYQMVEAVPDAGVVTVLEERRTVACNQFLERDRVEKERVRSEEEMARQRIEVEVEKERLRAEAAEVASADALMRQEARQ